MILKYDKGTGDWKDGLLIGNGRLHAAAWHEGQSDRLGLNHENLWTGTYGNRSNPERAEFLPYVRRFLKEKDYYRATALASLAFGGDGGISPYPRKEDMYIPAGDLVYSYKKAEDAGEARSLDMTHGLIQSEYSGVRMEAYADCISQWICVRWKSEQVLNGTLAFEYESYGKEEHRTITLEEHHGRLQYQIQVDDMCRYEVVIQLKTDGKLREQAGMVETEGSRWIESYINIAVSYCDIERELEQYPMPVGTWEDLFGTHKNRFKKEMEKTSIYIEDEHTAQLQQDTINRRLERLKAGHEDAELMAIYAEFGKYLMVSGSICGQLPLNLQGKWNCDAVPPWNCDYHFNINIQMNYWFAEQMDLGSCTGPLFDYVDRFVKSGEEAARRLYGCRGTWLSLNGDHWALSTPEAYNYAAWIGGAAWIAQHYWWHYRYSGDLEFLEERAYPLFKLAAEFYEDYIEIDEAGTAQIAPSQSPENRFKGTGEYPVSFCTSSAMDVQLAYDAFTYAAEASGILETDREQCRVWEELRRCLPEFQIGKDGRLLEWDDEKEEMEEGHRHYSHLYGLFPSNLFNCRERISQYEACRKSLEYRIGSNGGGTGWSRAWAACLYTRLQDGNRAYEQMKYLLTELSSATLLDLHPMPPRCKVRKPESGHVFQIDGNMGGTRAVADCLIQSLGGRVYLLPALPDAWKKGRVDGIKTEGGHKFKFSFCDGKVTELEIIMGFEKEIRLDNRNGCLGEEPELVITGEPGSHITILKGDKQNEAFETVNTKH